MNIDIIDLLVKIGLPILTLFGGIWLARQRAPFENRVSASSAEKSEAEADKTRAETITVQNSTIAGMMQQISTMHGTIFGMQNTQNAMTNDVNNLNVKVARQDLEIARLNTGNERLMVEVADGHKREDELKRLTVQQRRLIDAIPERMDLYDVELAKLGVVLPRNPVVDAARAAIDKEEAKPLSDATTAASADAAKVAIEAVATAIDETKKSVEPPKAIDENKK